MPFLLSLGVKYCFYVGRYKRNRFAFVVGKSSVANIRLANLIIYNPKNGEVYHLQEMVCIFEDFSIVLFVLVKGFNTSLFFIITPKCPHPSLSIIHEATAETLVEHL